MSSYNPTDEILFALVVSFPHLLSYSWLFGTVSMSCSQQDLAPQRCLLVDPNDTILPTRQCHAMDAFCGGCVCVMCGASSSSSIPKAHGKLLAPLKPLSREFVVPAEAKRCFKSLLLITLRRVSYVVLYGGARASSEALHLPSFRLTCLMCLMLRTWSRRCRSLLSFIITFVNAKKAMESAYFCFMCSILFSWPPSSALRQELHLVLYKRSGRAV